jgi:glycosyltransferase involved in cell wall biosynthesis
VTSNNTSLPEVVGDAAILVEPEDSESIADGIRRLLSSESLRDTLRERGLARVTRITWERTAEQTLKLLLAQAAI